MTLLTADAGDKVVIVLLRPGTALAHGHIVVAEG